MRAPSKSGCFGVSVEGKVAHIKLSRPEKMNAMSLAFWRELPEIAHELDARGDVRAAVISSTGKHFTAGMDLSVFQSNDALGTESVAALQPAIFSVEDIQRAVAAGKTGKAPEFADLPAKSK